MFSRLLKQYPVLCPSGPQKKSPINVYKETNRYSSNYSQNRPVGRVGAVYCRRQTPKNGHFPLSIKVHTWRADCSKQPGVHTCGASWHVTPHIISRGV